MPTVRSLLVAGGADPGADRDALLAQARSPAHKLAATLLSLWERDGEPLTAQQATELAGHRDRLDRYARTWEAIGKVAPDAYLIKGFTISSLYPDGVARSAGDLDVICHDLADIWAAAAYLFEVGWEVCAFTVTAARPGDGLAYNVMVELTLPEDDALGQPFAVGLLSAEIGTSTRVPPYWLHQPQRSPLATTMAALVAERWERPFLSRDMLDFMLLARQLGADDIAVLREHLARTLLWPEWQEARRSLARLGWQLPFDLPEAASLARQARIRRLVRDGARLVNPIRSMAFVAQRTVESEGARFAESVSDFFHERIGARHALAAGMPMFGVPVGPPEPDVAGLRLVQHGHHLVASCPVGVYLLVTGACKRGWLDLVSADGAAPE